MLGKQGKQNDAFCSRKLTEWTDVHEKIRMGNVGLCILVIYSSDVIAEEVAILLKAL